MKTTKSTFDLLDVEDTPLKIQKVHLAIKYLDFLSNEISGTQNTLNLNDQIKLIKTTQSLDALNYTLSFFQTESYDLLNQQCKSMIIKIYVSLIKAIHFNNPRCIKNEDTGEEEFNVFCRLVHALRIQSELSEAFCTEYSECTDSYAIIFKIVENFQYNENLLLPEDLIVFLLSLSKYHLKFADKWSSQAIEILNKFVLNLHKLDPANVGKEEWYIFLLKENLAKDSNYFDSTITYMENQDDKNADITKKLYLAIKYLKYMREPVRIIESHQCMNIIYYLTTYSEFIHFQTMESSLQEYFVGSSISLINFLHGHIAQEITKTESAVSKKFIKRDLVLIDKLSNIILNCSNESLNYCSKFHKVHNSIKILFDFIRDEHLITFLAENSKKKMSANLLKDCFENILCTLHNLSRVIYKYKALWDNNDAINVCILFSERLGSIEDNFRVLVYFILSNIASDKEIETLKEIKMAIKFISDLIIKCAESIENKTTTRSKVCNILLFNF